MTACSRTAWRKPNTARRVGLSQGDALTKRAFLLHYCMYVAATVPPEHAIFGHLPFMVLDTKSQPSEFFVCWTAMVMGELGEVRRLACSGGTWTAVTKTPARRARAPAVFTLLFSGGPACQLPCDSSCH